MSLPTIRKLIDVIDRSLFTIKPPLNYHQTTYAIIKLAELVHKYDGDSDELWAIGEYGNCDLASLLVGAYWHYSDWHSGQCSQSYRALCAVGQVYSPNMANGPEPDSNERDVFEQLGQLAQGAKPV